MNFENAVRVDFSRSSRSHSTAILVPGFETRDYKLLRFLDEAIENALGVFIDSLPSRFIYIHLKPKKQCRCINALDLGSWAANPVRIVGYRSIFFKPIDLGN
jgi:hypothetical protein